MKLMMNQVYECDFSFGKGTDWKLMRLVAFRGPDLGWPPGEYRFDFEEVGGPHEFHVVSDSLDKGWVREVSGA